MPPYRASLAAPVRVEWRSLPCKLLPMDDKWIVLIHAPPPGRRHARPVGAHPGAPELCGAAGARWRRRAHIYRPRAGTRVDPPHGIERLII
eukprot:scaffold95389_cov63-Phaeocystis_antarctica.AAC.3